MVCDASNALNGGEKSGKMVARIYLEFRRLKFYGVLSYLSMYPHRIGVLFTRVLLRRRYYSRNFDGFSMLLDLRDGGISSILATAGSREEETITILRQELESGMTVFDLGANIGFYGLFCANIVGPTGYILSVEPEVRNFDLLKKNVDRNGLNQMFDIWQIAISNTTGSGKLFIHKQANLHSLTTSSSLNQHRNGTEEMVNLVSARDFIGSNLGKHPQIDLIRMDIEGHEVEVLESLADAVKEFDIHPKILFENHYPKYMERPNNMRHSLQRLFDLGYYPKTLASTDERLAYLHKLGYFPKEVVKASMRMRGLYEGVSNEDAIDVICERGSIRTTLLSWKPGPS